MRVSLLMGAASDTSGDFDGESSALAAASNNRKTGKNQLRRGLMQHPRDKTLDSFSSCRDGPNGNLQGRALLILDFDPQTFSGEAQRQDLRAILANSLRHSDFGVLLDQENDTAASARATYLGGASALAGSHGNQLV